MFGLITDGACLPENLTELSRMQLEEPSQTLSIARLDEFAPKPTRTPATQGKPVERAKVLFAYTAENEDELSIEEGNIIYILEKELEDSGWWRGELNGDVGVFPDNFVELLPPEEIRPKKPPPPAMPMGAGMKASKPLPPDPIKPSEPPKLQKSVTEVKEEKKVGIASAKKPAVPPPVGKKPKPADPKLMAQTDDHKAKESQKGETSLDIVESTEKLSHPTRNRVRAPDRKLPSHRLTNGLQPNEEVEEVVEHGSPQLNDSRRASKKSSPSRPAEPPKEEKPPAESESKPAVNSAPGSPRRDPLRDSKRGAGQRPDPPKEGPPPMPPDVMAEIDHISRQENGEVEEVAPKLSSFRNSRRKRTSLSRGDSVETRSMEEKEKAAPPARAVRPPPPVLKDPVAPLSPPSTPRHQPKPRTPSPVHDVSASSNESSMAGQIADLDGKMAELRLSTVRKSEHEDLKSELASLQEQMRAMKASFDKKLFELMTEIDEEKKVRLTMQVEMDRLKKMLSS